MSVASSFIQRLSLACVLLLGTASWASAQTTRTVCATGCGFTTIQAAVDASSDGDDVLVLNGTYTENVVVDSKDIEIRSLNGRDNTVIQGMSGAGALGTVVVQGTTTGFTLDGFTVIGIDNGAPGIENAAVYVRNPASGSHTDLTIVNNEIQANGDNGFLAEFAATLTDPVFDNNLFTGQTFVGPNPAGSGFGQQFTLANVPRQLVVLGNGGGDAASARVTGLQFTNNELTGTAGGLNGMGEEQGNTLATLDAANATITGNLFAGTTTRFGAQLRVRRPGATISGNTFESDGLGPFTNHLFIQNNGTPLPTIAANNTFDRGAYAEMGIAITVAVSSAVFGAPDGDTVNIFPETYSEQIFVDGKALTIDGVDADSTTIIAPDAPATLANCFGSSQAVVCAINDADLTLQNVTVDGNGRGAAGSLIGVAIIESSGTVRNNIVQAVRDSPANGNQRGIAVLADNFDADPQTVLIESNTVRDFQKNGINIGGLGMTATVTGNAVLGEGPVDYTAQNGIQAAFGVSATISNNAVTGFSFDPVDNSRDFFDAAGILLFDGTDVTISGNTISACESCLLAEDTPATISGNTITTSEAATDDDDYTGIFVYSFNAFPEAARLAGGDAFTGRSAKRQPAAQLAFFDRTTGELASLDRAAYASGRGGAAVITYDILNNAVTGGDEPDSLGVGIIGIAFADGDTTTVDPMLDLQIEGNDVGGFGVGIDLEENEPGLVLPVDLDGFNFLDGNDLALFSALANDVDAEDNFWGPTTEPAIAALIDNQGTGEVDFVPFIGSTFQVDLEATATSSLSVQPGSSVSFQYTIENNNMGPVSGDLYFVAERAATGIQVAQGRIVSGNVPGGATLMGSFSQNVPGNTPPGDYVYRLRIGQFPNFTVDVVVFTATVQSGPSLAGGAESWSVAEATPWMTAEAFAAAQEAGSETEAVAAASEALPTEFGVTSAPNPATHRATLTVAVPEAGPVTVTVYDVRGREVAVAVDRDLEAGTHSVGLDVAGLASGVYIVRAQSAERVAVQRITVVR